MLKIVDPTISGRLRCSFLDRTTRKSVHGADNIRLCSFLQHTNLCRVREKTGRTEREDRCCLSLTMLTPDAYATYKRLCCVFSTRRAISLFVITNQCRRIRPCTDLDGEEVTCNSISGDKCDNWSTTLLPNSSQDVNLEDLKGLSTLQSSSSGSLRATGSSEDQERVWKAKAAGYYPEVSELNQAELSRSPIIPE